jgi:membrane-associated phospholipid phosphatase
VKAFGRLRSSEWLLIGYFAYVAAIAPAFPLQSRMLWRPAAVALLVTALLASAAYGEATEHRSVFSTARDWLALALTLVAYREMDWFSPLSHNLRLELRWVEWDRTILYGARLHNWGIQRAIESSGALLPSYLELCYALVYAVGPCLVAILYIERRRELVNGAIFLYLLGTLLSYALFPYFPSGPPRIAFGGSDMPNAMTPVRELNLWIVNGYGIHSSVFPSAHVSSAFSAAWALFLYLPSKRRCGWGMLIYAVSVSVAAVYGRYHYAADVVAGFVVSLAAAGFTILLALPRPRRPHVLP